MTKKITQKMTDEIKTKALEERGKLLDKWVATSGFEKVKSWMDDPDLRGIINTLAYLEAIELN